MAVAQEAVVLCARGSRRLLLCASVCVCVRACVCVCVRACVCVLFLCVCACMRVAGVRQQLVWSGIGNQRVQTELKHTCDRDLTVACTSDDLNAPSTSSTASRYCSCATQKPQNQSKHSAHTDTQTVKT